MKRVALGAVLMAWALTAWADVDVASANRAQLEQLRGIGPPLAEAILAEREKGAFKDWADLIARVRGIKAAKARQLSAAGLRVGGAPYDATPPR
jgi:competence protein ComEA